MKYKSCAGRKEIRLKKNKSVLSKIIGLTLCICLCLVLAACGNSDSEGDTKEAAKYEKAAAVDNGTLTDDSVAVSVGKTTVSYAEYRAYDYFMKNQFESVLGQDVWNYKLDGAGRTVGQDAIEDILRLIIQVKVINRAAADQKIVLAADEKEEADNSASKYCESISDEIKKDKGINAALVSSIFEENKLAEKMYNIIIGKAKVKLSDEQCRAARVQLIYLKADSGSREEVKKSADELKRKAEKAGNFYRFAKEHTQSDQIECLVGKQDARTKLAEAALKLKQGGISEVIEETDGYYIAYCVSRDSKAVRAEYKNQVVEERQNEAFARAYSDWAAGYEVKASRSLLVEV